LRGWDGRPEDPAIGGWYWLYRAEGGNDVRHAAWYWCGDCRQWEAEPSLSLAPDAVAAEGWRILAAAIPPPVDGRDDLRE
jgi:hypothetical protein